MKIAVFSNLWPPVFIGGYEIGASKVVEELRCRGHDTLVIAAHDYHLNLADGTHTRGSHGRAERPATLDAGHCQFGPLWEYVKRRKLLILKDVAATLLARHRYRRAIHAFRPDCLLAFNPGGVLAPVLDDFVAYSRTTGVPVNCYLSDFWLTEWPATHPLWPRLAALGRSPSRWVRAAGWLAGRLLRTVGLVPESAPCVDRYFYCSDYLRRSSAGSAAGGAEHVVAHWGLAAVRGGARRAAGHFQSDGPLTLLYAGQIMEHKGLPVLLQALACCRAAHRLVVIGDDQSGYAAECKRLALRLGVRERVDFVGKKRHEEMPALLARAGQVLVVPSVWEEPFSLVVMEGMAVGLAVVASDTGGTGEILRHGRNGFLFPRNDAAALGAIIDRLEADRGLCERVGNRARACVLRHFTIEQLVDQLEAHLAGTSPEAGE